MKRALLTMAATAFVLVAALVAPSRADAHWGDLDVLNFDGVTTCQDGVYFGLAYFGTSQFSVRGAVMDVNDNPGTIVIPETVLPPLESPPVIPPEGDPVLPPGYMAARYYRVPFTSELPVGTTVGLAFPPIAAGNYLVNRVVSACHLFTRQVSIDVWPFLPVNPVNPSRGLVPVALFGDASFDVATITPGSIRFGAAGTEAAPVLSVRFDLNGDGRLDQLFVFRARDTAIACGATNATLTGRTTTGASFSGSDSIKTIGCP